MVMIKNYIESFSYEENIPRNEKIEKGRTKFFDFDYPFFDETKRKDFETRLIKHFYMRESVETIGLTKFRLEDYLNLNMPYWNKIFESELMSFPVFEDFDYNISENEVVNKDTITDSDIVRNETNNREDEINEKTDNLRTTSDNTNEDNFQRSIFSDTPQSDLKIAANGNGTGVVNKATNIEENKNLNNMVANGSQTDDNTRSQNANRIGTENETRNIDTNVAQNEDRTNEKVFKGKKGSTDYADLMLKYRSTLLRIEKRIFDEINKEGIFLLIYGGR